MAHRRQVLPRTELVGSGLDEALVGIGVNLAAPPAPTVNIEDALFFASREAMDRGDLRIFGLLVQWLEVHIERVNADRLTRIASGSGSSRVKLFWSAVASTFPVDRRLRRLAQLYQGPRQDLASAGTEFQVARHGEDERFAGSLLRVAGNVIRRRSADIATPAEIAERNRAYYYRVMMGPSYRADLWATLERAPELSTSDLARAAYASFATAWAAKRDFELLARSSRGKGDRTRQVA